MIRRQASVFAVNGLIAVVLAYGVYRGLLGVGVIIEIANALAYLAGMTFGFFANKFCAFRESSEISISQMLRYLALHVCTLGVNVAVNLSAFEAMRGLDGQVFFAFSLAIAISAALNFLGLKYWVFSPDNRSTA